MLDGCAGGEQHDGDVAGVEVRLDTFAQFGSRHAGHDDVAHDNVGLFLANLFPCLFTVGGCCHLVKGSENFGQHLTDGFIVFHYQHFVGTGLGFGGLVGIHFTFQQDVHFRFVDVDLLDHMVPAVYFFLLELTVSQREGDDEAGSLAQGTFHPDGSVMQFYNAFGQGQADAGTR